MARTKSTITKRLESDVADENQLVVEETLPEKIIRPLETEDPEIFGVPAVEEKVEEDPLIAETDDELSEDAGLDEEDINPFGDKWEE